MGLPRSKYVEEGKEDVYQCFSRCVRRAFLYGYDALTGRDFSHRANRKHWQRFFVVPSLPDNPQPLIKSIMSTSLSFKHNLDEILQQVGTAETRHCFCTLLTIELIVWN